ncbi:GNAT family N-acetyltransferase [Nonomuraea sp. NPDC050556]|uniref:GNAT family N-acetyltransferase n=1 Tax=Nonomuraea sp. NPDC050556 TaxID=3364369 RepID=UPI0037A2AAF6
MSAAIRTATSADAVAVTELIAQAFEPLGASAYLVPDLSVRREVLAGQFIIMVEHALAVGQVDVIGAASPVAAAVWFDHTAPVPPPPDYDNRLKAATGQWHSRFLHLDEVLESNHPTEPHHFLLFLAVHPDHQNHGLGSALLDHHHTTALGGNPAYLDAASPASRDLYARHGYEGRPPYDIAAGARFWPMWRP